jgi:hypothetical protein
MEERRIQETEDTRLRLMASAGQGRQEKEEKSGIQGMKKIKFITTKARK